MKTSNLNDKLIENKTQPFGRNTLKHISIANRSIHSIDEADQLIPYKNYPANNHMLTNGELIWEISKICYPVCLSYICLFLQETVILSFIGQKYNNKDMIEGVGVAILYNNCLLFSICVGISTGFDTLGSNAYGVKNMRLFGYYFHRAIVVSYVVGISLLTLSYFFSMNLIALFNFKPDILQHCDEYITVAMFFVLFDIQFNLNFRYLNIVEKSHINILILFCTILLHPIWCYLTINVFEMGLTGAGLSFVFSQFLNAFLTSIYIIFKSPYPESVFFFNATSFHNFGEFLSISMPAMILNCAEFWAFECFAIVAIFCSELDYSVYVLVNNIMLNCYSVSMGFCTACTILSGEFISQNNIVMVKKIKTFCLLYSTVIMTILGILLLIYRRHLLFLFIDNEEIIESGAACFFYVAIGLVGDGLQATMQGYYRGVGKHLIATVICFISYYVLMLGTSLILAIALDYHVLGIWIAYFLGVYLTFCVYYILEFSFDYEHLCNVVNLRIEIVNCSRSSAGSVSHCPSRRAHDGKDESDMQIEHHENTTKDNSVSNTVYKSMN